MQAPPNLSDDLAPLLEAGIDDWGGVSPVTADHVNPERTWPALDVLGAATEAAGHTLAPRLTVYPSFALDPGRWLDPAVRFAVLDASDAEGLARDAAWCSGARTPPPPLRPRPRSARPAGGGPGAVAEVLAGVALGQEVGIDEIVTLFSARGPEVRQVAEVADDLRRPRWATTVTFVPTATSTTPTCARSSAGSAPSPRARCRSTSAVRPICSSWTRSLAGWPKPRPRVPPRSACRGGSIPTSTATTTSTCWGRSRAASETIHIHGFTALEVTEGARRSGVSLAEYLVRLKESGLKTLPGTAAEILDDEVRAILCPDKIDTEEWLEAHRTAHGVGLRSNVTIMFGAVEQPVCWARHIVRTRALQRETGGFTEFVPLPFVHMATPLYLQRRARRGPTFREALLMHAVGRIAYAGDIDNIQVSWVKMGTDGCPAGAPRRGQRLGRHPDGREHLPGGRGAHGQRMGVEELETIVAPLGRPAGAAHHPLRRTDAGTDRPRRGASAGHRGTLERRQERRPAGVPLTRCSRAARWPRRSGGNSMPMVGHSGRHVAGGHGGGRPEDRRRGVGRDGRGLPGVPAVPPRAQDHDVRFGPDQPDDPIYVLARRLAAVWPRPAGWW